MAVSIKGPGGGSTKMEITNGKLEEYVAYPENLEKNTFVEINQQNVIMDKLIKYDNFNYNAHSKLLWEDDISCLIMYNEASNDIMLLHVETDEQFGDYLKHSELATLTNQGFDINQCNFLGKMSGNRFAFYLYAYNLTPRLVIAKYEYDYPTTNKMVVGTSLSVPGDEDYKYCLVGDNIIGLKPREYSYSYDASLDATLYTVNDLTITERSSTNIFEDDRYNADKPLLNAPYITGNNSAIIFAKKSGMHNYTITPISISENTISVGTSVENPTGISASAEEIYCPVDDTSLIFYMGSSADYCICKENKLYVGALNNSEYANFESGVISNVSSGKVVYHSSNTTPTTLMYLEKTDTTLTQRFYGTTTDIVGIIYDIFVPSYDDSIVHFIGEKNNAGCLWRAKFENNTIVYKDSMKGSGTFGTSTRYAGRAGDIGVVTTKFGDWDDFTVAFITYNSQNLIPTYRNIFEPPQDENSLKLLNDGKRIWLIYEKSQTVYIISHVIDLTINDVYDEKNDLSDVISNFHSSGIFKIFPRSNGVMFISFIQLKDNNLIKDTFVEFDIFTNSTNDIIIPGYAVSKAKNKIDGLSSEKIKKMDYGNVAVLNTEN